MTDYITIINDAKLQYDSNRLNNGRIEYQMCPVSAWSSDWWKDTLDDIRYGEEYRIRMLQILEKHEAAYWFVS